MVEGPWLLRWDLRGPDGPVGREEWLPQRLQGGAVQYPQAGGPELLLEVTRHPDGALELRPGLRWAGRDCQVDALVLSTEVPEPGPLHFFPTGYSSFTPAWRQGPRWRPPRPRFPTSGTFNQHSQSVYYRDAGARSSPWAAVLQGEDAGAALLCGYLTAREGLGEVALRARRLELRQSFGGRALRAGEALWGEALWLCRGAGEELLQRWAALAGQRMGARLQPERPVPSGWCSWYYYYTGVTEAQVRANLRDLQEARPRLQARTVQLDDGFQTAVGDWLGTNAKFPGGLRALAAEVRLAGFAPGIWTAPFLAQRGSRVLQEHPEWFLRDPKGRLRPLGYHPFWGVREGHVYSLDLSHPGALSHLGRTFRALREFGYEYFKIDFLFAGLREGQRHDPSASPVAAYRRGLAVIREAIGEDAFLLGCGAPLLPSVGLVDGMRVSPDVKEAWRDPLIGWLAGGAGHPSAELAIVNNLTRAHLHQRLFVNDPDCLLVRRARSALRLPEVHTLVSVLGLGGGALFLSDDLTTLPPQRRALLELALPPRGAAAQTLGLCTEERPWRFARFQEGPAGREALAALINFADHPQEVALEPALLGLAPGPYHAFELWSRRYRLLEPGRPWRLARAAHGTALVLLRPAQPRPQLVGLTHHLGQTTTVATEAWDGEELQVTLETGAAREGQLWLAAPPGFRLEAARAEGDAALGDRYRVGPCDVLLVGTGGGRGQLRCSYTRLGSAPSSRG